MSHVIVSAWTCVNYRQQARWSSWWFLVAYAVVILFFAWFLRTKYDGDNELDTGPVELARKNITEVIKTLKLVFLDGDLRLAGSDKPHEGRLEVYYNGSWGTICDDNFDNIDASVACYQLGLG